MKRYLLILSLFICSLGVVAQTVNDKFTLHEFKQTTDDMVTGKFSYSEVLDANAKSITFEIINYKKIGGDYSPETYAGFDATERVPEGETLSSDTQFSFYIDGLDLTGNVIYKFAIKAIKHMNDDSTVEELVFVYKQGNNYKVTTDEAQATEFTFTYGLAIPELSNKKSSSVVISWSKECVWGEPEFYTIYGRNMNKPIATTTETSYFINNLISGYDYSFFVRAYDANGNYLSSSSDVLYTPERVDCITFTDVKVENNSIALSILGYDNDGPFQTEASVYRLKNADEEIVCNSIDREGFLNFEFESIDYSEEFRLETEKVVEEKKIKAVGIFRLKSDGSGIEEQYCDIVFDLWATHVTQYTATIEWSNPGFDAQKAVLEIYNIDKDPDLKNEPEQKINISNPRAYKYSVGALEHSTNYKFILKLSDTYNNQAKDDVKIKTKVGSICGLENTTSASIIGCGNNGFLAPYDVEFYTEDIDGQPTMTVRFRLNSADEINNVSLFYGPNPNNILEFIFTIKAIEMKKGEDGWYSCTFDKLGGNKMKTGDKMYFAVMLTPAKRCSWLSLSSFYLTKSVAYQVGTGCQDEEIFQIVEFEKLYDTQSQFTLKTTGRMASVGVFPESGYNKTTGEFDLDQRKFYNNFDDAPSSFTLDISDPVKYPVGKYYLHIHDVYGEAADLKYLWAIY
ncbi:MAG: fibronectin type III domain-containing protein [Paludibacteraceae bacterium]|nr:fibronectin type III domain-containing protein [Paludibacteraceae bacterium]